MRTGSVALVGAGPGHVDYLTLAGLKALQQADVILYDALLAAAFHQLFPKRAKALYVGKRCGQHALSQSEINDLLVAQASKGRRVVRLKGGDPFIFGRGAEEIAALRAAGIPYQVIPGVSALNGVAAMVTLPLTLRGAANEFRAIQGHHLPDDPKWWQELAAYQGTIALFMGLEKLPQFLQRLVDYGRDPKTPLALIESDATGFAHATQSSLSACLKAGYQRLAQGPVIVYLGENVRFMDRAMPACQTFTEETDHVAAAHLR